MWRHYQPPRAHPLQDKYLLSQGLLTLLIMLFLLWAHDLKIDPKPPSSRIFKCIQPSGGHKGAGPGSHRSWEGVITAFAIWLLEPLDQMSLSIKEHSIKCIMSVSLWDFFLYGSVLVLELLSPGCCIFFLCWSDTVAHEKRKVPIPVRHNSRPIYAAPLDTFDKCC